VLASVITTIHPPTPASRVLANRVGKSGGKLYIAGDSKGPDAYNAPHTVFLSLDVQLKSAFDLARILPTRHYCRKNVAYLQAMTEGATCIYETDDDNEPMDGWCPRTEILAESRAVASGERRWVNVYRYFSSDFIWPRGLPLDEIRRPAPETSPALALRAPVQQGLVNNSPDVDAIWRLTMDRPFDFAPGESVYLCPGNWCPFNTQSTWWWPVAYPLLYVPSFCSFRMCDIWKSFVAQRCLWEMGLGIAFHAPEVIQERNPHDLMCDFRDEIPGYSRNRELVDLLGGLSLKAGEENVMANLRSCYAVLVDAGFFPAKEMELVDAWQGDLERMA
jgi:hypothetical protein